MTKVAQTLAIILLALLGALAIGGGSLLILAPSGKSMQFPLELLDGTPFTNYLLPGLILFFSIGVLSLIIAVLIFKKAPRYPRWIILEGLILLGWLSIELWLNPDFFVPYMHYPLYVIGVLLLILGVVIKEA